MILSIFFKGKHRNTKYCGNCILEGKARIPSLLDPLLEKNENFTLQSEWPFEKKYRIFRFAKFLLFKFLHSPQIVEVFRKIFYSLQFQGPKEPKESSCQKVFDTVSYNTFQTGTSGSVSSSDQTDFIFESESLICQVHINFKDSTF